MGLRDAAWCQDAQRRANRIVAVAPGRPGPGLMRQRVTVALAAVFAAQAATEGAAVVDVPIARTGYLLAAVDRAKAFLEMAGGWRSLVEALNAIDRRDRLSVPPAAPDPGFGTPVPVDPRPVWETPLQEARHVVGAAWLCQVGRLRIGDRVQVLPDPGWEGLKPTWEGVLTSVWWPRQDRGGHFEATLPEVPPTMHVTTSDETGSRPVHPSNVLLASTCLDPVGRGLRQAVYSARHHLDHAERRALEPGIEPAWALKQLTYRIGFYPDARIQEILNRVVDTREMDQAHVAARIRAARLQLGGLA